MGSWAYAGDDPGLQLFTLAASQWRPKIDVPGRVLEIGCCETTFLEHMRDVNTRLELVGVDWRIRRAPFAMTVRADVRDPELFDEQSFDAIVSISAVEHIGLGHYKHDPPDADGDTRTMRNVARWLKPGGWCYLDVPFTPEGFKVDGTRYRGYDADALLGRLVPPGLTLQQVGFVAPDACMTWIPQPKVPCEHAKYPYYYAAMLLEKAA